MREDVFRTVLARSFDPPTVSSYLAYARRVERDLQVDLDAIDLDEDNIAALHSRLVQSGMPLASANNCRSAIRRYTGSGIARPIRAVAAESLPTSPARPAWIAEATIAGLVHGYGQILDELRARGVLRTANAPVGDYAEYLFARAFGCALQGNSTSGHDAVDPDGVRYQVKARRLATPRTSRQLGGIRKIDADPFDRLAAILFNADMTVKSAVLIPMACVKRLCTYSAHTNSWRLMLTDAVLATSDVIDVTNDLRRAAEDGI